MQVSGVRAGSDCKDAQGGVKGVLVCHYECYVRMELEVWSDCAIVIRLKMLRETLPVLELRDGERDSS